MRKLAGRGLDNAGDRVHERRFAGAVRGNHDDNLSGLDGEGHVIATDDLLLAGIRLGEAGHFQERLLRIVENVRLQGNGGRRILGGSPR
jgi:hypothetical protein